jgi:protein-tyrosine phosphatase
MAFRWIELEGAVNVRALADGVLLRSDNLQDLTEADVRRLVEDEGVRTVIDLRTEVEVELEGEHALHRDDRVDVQHHSLYPSQGNTDVDADWIAPWGDGAGAEHEDPTVAAYLGYLERRPDSIVAALRAIATTDGAVLVHCAAGKDRTGTVCALALAAAGRPDEEVVEDYLATRGRIELIMARLAATSTYAREIHPDPDRHAPRPGVMEAVLTELRARHGGPEAYLEAHGLVADELAALRRRLAG